MRSWCGGSNRGKKAANAPRPQSSRGREDAECSQLGESGGDLVCMGESDPRESARKVQCRGVSERRKCQS